MTGDRVLTVFRERLRRTPFGAHPGLLFSPWLEGYRDHTFGGKAGPSVGITHLMHELGHAAEFGPAAFKSRGREFGFVFRTKEVEILGRMYPQPLTSQATHRELRTFANQLHLMRLAGEKVSEEFFFDDSAYVMRLMPDCWNIPGEGEDGRRAFCAEAIRNYYESTTAAEVVDRLVGWLDLTAAKLRMKDCPRPYHRIETRYRLTGELVS